MAGKSLAGRLTIPLVSMFDKGCSISLFIKLAFIRTLLIWSISIRWFETWVIKSRFSSSLWLFCFSRNVSLSFCFRMTFLSQSISWWLVLPTINSSNYFNPLINLLQFSFISTFLPSAISFAKVAMGDVSNIIRKKSRRFDVRILLFRFKLCSKIMTCYLFL